MQELKKLFGPDFTDEQVRQIYNVGFVLSKDYSTLCDKCNFKKLAKDDFCPVCQVDLKAKTIKAGVAEKVGY